MSRPVAIYNAEKKELIGVFDTQAMAGRYLYPLGTKQRGCKSSSSISDSITKRRKIGNTRFPFKVAARFANESQIELIKKGCYYVSNGYPIPAINEIKGFTGSSHSMYEDWKIQTNRRLEEKRRINADKPIDLL